MYVIPKDLEMKFAFPEFTISQWTFQILVQDIVSLLTLPLIIPYALSMYNIIPDFLWLKLLCGCVVFIFTFYLVVWACPTPKLKNYDRLIIWLKRPKRTYSAPITGSQELINLLDYYPSQEVNLVE